MAEDENEEPWQYKRTCMNCGFTWGSSHCPHDSYQGKCDQCGLRAYQENGDCHCEYDY